MTSTSSGLSHHASRIVRALVVMGALLLCLALIWPLLAVIGWAFVLAVVIAPLNAWLGARRVPPGRAAALSTAAVVLLVLAPALLISARLARDAAAFAAAPPPQSLRLRLAPTLQRALSWAGSYIEVPSIDPDALIRSSVLEVGRTIGRGALSVLKNAVWTAIQAVILVITVYFVLRDGARGAAFVRRLSPLPSEETEAVIQSVLLAARATIFGNSAVALAQGALAGAGYLATSIPAPLLWTVVTTVLCLVPVLGAPVVWGPASLYLAIQGKYGPAVGLALWGLLVVGTVDNILRPLVISSRTQLHPLPILLAAIGGTVLMGPLGIFAGPVLLAAACSVLIVPRQSRSAESNACPAAGAAAGHALPSGLEGEDFGVG